MRDLAPDRTDLPPDSRRVIETAEGFECFYIELPPGTAFQAALIGGVSVDERAAQFPVRTAHQPRNEAELSSERLRFGLRPLLVFRFSFLIRSVQHLSVAFKLLRRQNYPGVQETEPG